MNMVILHGIEIIILIQIYYWNNRIDICKDAIFVESKLVVSS